MGTISILRQVVTGLGVILVVLGITSCSNLDNPLTPLTPTGSPRSIRADAFVPVSFGQAGHSGVRAKPVSKTQRVSALLGGTVTLSGSLDSGNNSYSYSLSFPSGALAQDTNITISAPDDATVEVDLGPGGTQFLVPVTFTVITNGTGFTFPSQNLDVYVFNPVTGQWNGLGASITGTPGAETQSVAALQHFSRYSLGGSE